MASVWSLVTNGTAETAKNVHVQVNGYIDDSESTLDWQSIVTAAEVHAGSFRLDAVNYAISDKTEVLLAWDREAGEGEPHVFLPLNGRGRLDFDSVNGLRNTVGSGKTGNILISVYGTSKFTRRSYFTLTLDLSKQKE